MSLLSPDLRIALLPGRAALARTGRSLDVAEAGQGLAGAIAALERLVPRAGVRGRTSITLSHHFVSLFLVPPPPTWLKRGEMNVWLGEQLAEPLGSRDGWRLTWPDMPPARPIPVCAMAEADLQMIDTTLNRLGLRAGHICPWLDLAWGRRTGQLRRASGWYALVEPGCIGLLRLERGQPLQIRQRQFSDDPVQSLAALLQREALLGGPGADNELWLERAGVSGNWQTLGQHLGAAWRVHELATAADTTAAMVS